MWHLHCVCLITISIHFISAWQLIVYSPLISSAQFIEKHQSLTSRHWWRVSLLKIIYRLALPRDVHWDSYFLVPCHMINNRREVGRSIQLNRLKALMVSFENPLHAITVRVLNVAILRKIKAKNEWYRNGTMVGRTLYYYNTLIQ